MKTKTNLSQTNPATEVWCRYADFFERRVQQRYTSEKRQADVPQCGRSMIEMLGVLAIIGMLTVGSITGYSKAMRRHLLNRQAEQISYILSTFEINYERLDLSSNSALSANPLITFNDIGWIPQEMVKNSTNYIYDVFNNPITFYFNRGGHRISLDIYIQKSGADQCVNLYTIAQQFHTFVSQVTIFGKSKTYSFYGDRLCWTPAVCTSKQTFAKITQYCNDCMELNTCRFIMYYP